MLLVRARKLVTGSRLEPLARWAYQRFWPSLHARYERETAAIMARWLRPDSNCIDVGAHRGSVLRDMFSHAPRGTHYAFEPLPEFCEQLRATFPAARVYQIALSDRTEMRSFQHVIDDPGLSGFEATVNVTGRHRVQTVEVAADRLDTIVPIDLPIRMLKIDVEGAEALVFRGAVDTIRTHRPLIIFEHGLGAADRYEQSGPDGVHDLLTKECHLRIGLMRSWLRDEPPLSRQAFVDQFEQITNYYFVAYP